MHDKLFINALVVMSDGCKSYDIGVDSGIITALYERGICQDAKEVIDCSGKMIFPGAIDTHGHMTSRENFDTGTKNAAKGGITTVVEMPLGNHKINTTSAEMLEKRKAEGMKDARVDFALWGGLTRNTLDNIAEQDKAGAIGFKIFTSFAGDDYPYMDDYAIMEGMKTIRSLNSIITVHCENESICSSLTAQYKGKGPEFFEKSRPIIAEAEAVNRIVFFAEQTGCRTMVCHNSCPEAVEYITRGKKNGIDIYAETCPHYLSLDKSYIEKYEGFAKCSPPLRSSDKVDGLWEKIRCGEIDAVGADHSGYPVSEKDKGVWGSSGGLLAMDLYMPLLISEGLNKRGIPAEAIAAATSLKPAKVLGLYPKKGSISIGADADLAIIDPAEEWTFKISDTFYNEDSKDPRFPFEGYKFKGNVTATYVRGNAVFENGVIKAEKGYGQFLTRP